MSAPADLRSNRYEPGIPLAVALTEPCLQSASAALQPILKYIAANLPDPTLDIESLASRFGMSKGTLNKRFREALGCSTWSHVRALRIRVARRLLEDGEIAVWKVAESVGYGTVRGFFTAYEKQFGESPGATRGRA